VLRVGLPDVPGEGAIRDEVAVPLPVVLLPTPILPRRCDMPLFFDLSAMVPAVACFGALSFAEDGALIIAGVLAGLAGVIVTFRDRLDGWVLAGEEGTMRLGRADETVLGLVPIGAAIDDLDVILPPDDFDLASAVGFTGVLRPGVITAR
jgi:hypothetical protein